MLLAVKAKGVFCPSRLNYIYLYIYLFTIFVLVSILICFCANFTIQFTFHRMKYIRYLFEFMCILNCCGDRFPLLVFSFPFHYSGVKLLARQHCSSRSILPNCTIQLKQNKQFDKFISPEIHIKLCPFETFQHDLVFVKRCSTVMSKYLFESCY